MATTCVTDAKKYLATSRDLIRWRDGLNELIDIWREKRGVEAVRWRREAVDGEYKPRIEDRWKRWKRAYEAAQPGGFKTRRDCKKVLDDDFFAEFVEALDTVEAARPKLHARVEKVRKTTGLDR